MNKRKLDPSEYSEARKEALKEIERKNEQKSLSDL